MFYPLILQLKGDDHPPITFTSATTGNETASSSITGIFHREQEILTQKHSSTGNLSPSARGLAAIYPCSGGDKQRCRQEKQSLSIVPINLGSEPPDGCISSTVPSGTHFLTSSRDSRILAATPSFPGAIFGRLSLPQTQPFHHSHPEGALETPNPPTLPHRCFLCLGSGSGSC